MAAQVLFDKSLQRLQFVFHLNGFTFESKKLTPLNKLKLRFVYYLNFFWVFSDVLGAIWWFVDGIQTGKTFIQLTYVSPCITFSLLANLKAIFVIRYEDLICDLIDGLRKLDNEDTHEGFRRDNIKIDDVKFLHSVLKCSNILNTVLVVTFTVSPLILIALKYFETKEVELILPFLIIYPFDSHDIRHWPFVYVHQFWSVCIVLLNCCGSDYLLYICCTYLGIQFRLLQHDIVKTVEKSNFILGREQELFQQKCAQLIRWHQEVMRLSSMLEFIYAESMLVNFVSSSIIICLTGFNVMEIENVAFAVTFLVFLTASLLQIYLLCFFGDILMRSSMGVSDAVYNCKWYYLNARLGKNLLIVQSSAQKPCKLTAFGFSDVNLRAFMSVLSSAWSYFALLKTVYTPPKV